MPRIIEPEIIDDKEQVLAYTNADFSDSNNLFIDIIFKTKKLTIKNILDIGCGPATIPVQIVTKYPSIKITAIDASYYMIKHANKTVHNAGFEKNITILLGCIPSLKLNHYFFDTIISKDVLHHLADPMVFWNELKRIRKLINNNIYIMDLFRPESIEKAKQIVTSVSSNEPEVLKKDFYHSLLAAFTVNEVKTQLKKANINLNFTKISERHFMVKGIL
jgi:ubiquinone/menaquinone biosynthesis C-methylase UbiE